MFINIFSFAICNASVLQEEQYCSTQDGYDYYVTSVVRPHNPLLYWVGVRRSDDVYFCYRFEFDPDNRTFSYGYGLGKTPPKESLERGQVEDNQLANDILYIALQYAK